jgi:Mn2+/Fe2+ NRAMP family transporter
LAGPALLVDVPRNSNITGALFLLFHPFFYLFSILTNILISSFVVNLVIMFFFTFFLFFFSFSAEVMKELNIPRGVRRVLFRTLNTDKYEYCVLQT